MYDKRSVLLLIYIEFKCNFSSSSSLCIFPQGVNAAFDVLLICNVNVYDLSQRLLLRRNPLDVSYNLYTLLLYCVINYALPCVINAISHT